MSNTTSLTILENINKGNVQMALKRAIDHSLNHPYDAKKVDLVHQLADELNSPSEKALQLLQGFISQLPESNTNVPMNVKALEIQNISKHYNKGNFSFSNVSFDLERGKLTGIVGQNGNGKTTLLRMLAGELAPSNGLINYSMINNHGDDPYLIKSKIGFIPQRIPKWYGKLEDNLHFTLSCRNFNPEENKFRVEIMLKRLGLYPYKNHLWTEISSGYRTRFELARVLLTEPKILILDEPLANLDIKAQQTFLQDLKFIAQSEINPIAVIFSSQQLHEVEQVADDIILIKEGKCLFQSKNKEEESEHIVIEFISDCDYQLIQKLKENHGYEILSENNFYTLKANKEVKLKTIVNQLLDSDIEFEYLRNISNSTKRLF